MSNPVTDRVLELLPDARLHREDNDCEDRHLIIWGPPGTGKTTSLMTLLNAHLEAGAPSHQVMVATFTRNAKREVFGRLGARFGLQEPELPWVRTIHSAAYRLLELTPEKVMGPRALEAFSKESGYELRGQLFQRSVDDPFGTASIETFGDWCHAAEELRRAKLLSFKEAEQQFHPPGVAAQWSAREAEAYAMTYERWKRGNYLVDFSDMLESVVEEELRPNVHWIFVDEAQDLTPLQWKVIDCWAQQVVRLWVFGDDDQAIYSFAGADPKALWSRPGHQFVLSHSYRLADKIHAEANRLIKRTGQRVAKAFEPHRAGGQIEERWSWDDVDYAPTGSWLLLARNRVFLEQARVSLQINGVPFKDRTSASGMPGPNTARGRAVQAVVELNEGRLVTKRSTIRHLRDQVPTNLWPRDLIGAKAVYGLLDLVDAGASQGLLDLITKDPLAALKGTVADREYLRRVWKRAGAEAFREEPKVELSTIHGVKGEEADHVVVSTAMTRRTHDEYVDDPDPEHRCYYVAVTRAKESLTWLQGGSRTFYRV